MAGWRAAETLVHGGVRAWFQRKVGAKTMLTPSLWLKETGFACVGYRSIRTWKKCRKFLDRPAPNDRMTDLR